jgi:hypothetical protein
MTQNFSSSNEPIIMFLDENAGIERLEDEYEKYDPEPGYEEGLKQDGWYVVESRLELRDR